MARKTDIVSEKKAAGVQSAGNQATGNNPRKRALVLSGGGSRGAYQVGVWRALVELGWEFDMVVGVSVGSLNGAMVVQKEQILAESLWRDLETDNIFDVSNKAQTADFAVEFIKQGGAGSHGLQKFVDSYIDDQKVRESEIDFGLLVVETPTMKPHYLWKKDIPEGRIGDYVMASSSAFPAVQAYDIDGKKYIDGGFENVMPIHMAVERGATDIVAVYLQAVGKFDRAAEISSAQNAGANLTLIEPKWDLGNFLLFNKDNTARIIRLGYQDAMKAFDVYDGEYYSFIKGTIGSRKLKAAEAAGKIFEVEPLTLYNLESFSDKLGKAVGSISEKYGDLLKVGQKITSSIGGAGSEDKVGINTVIEAVQSIGAIELKQSLTVDERNKLNRKIATLIIAKDIRANGPDSLFINRYALKLGHDEILAARFIDSQGLL